MSPLSLAASPSFRDRTRSSSSGWSRWRGTVLSEAPGAALFPCSARSPPHDASRECTCRAPPAPLPHCCVPTVHSNPTARALGGKSASSHSQDDRLGQNAIALHVLPWKADDGTIFHAIKSTEICLFLYFQIVKKLKDCYYLWLKQFQPRAKRDMLQACVTEAEFNTGCIFFPESIIWA